MITGTELINELNDLLRLDHDAVEAYSLAISQLEDAEHQNTLLRFRADHEKHTVALTQLIREHGGEPVQTSHASSGPFKLAVQQLAGMGGTREILLAFKANEGQVVEKYRRATERGYPNVVTAVIEGNRQDEERHYQWVETALAELGAGRGSVTGRAEQLFEEVHRRVADTLEQAERFAAAPADATRVEPSSSRERRPRE